MSQEQRDDKKHAYTPDQQRVADYIAERSGGNIGGGDDPIGFVLASYEYLDATLKRLTEMQSAVAAPSLETQLRSQFGINPDDSIIEVLRRRLTAHLAPQSASALIGVPREQLAKWEAWARVRGNEVSPEADRPSFVSDGLADEMKAALNATADRSSANG